ncbi:ATP-binding protein [Rugamonas aquatica]|uniref:ATPase AAA-type core domain-containing protein n=1 Tax=Rugamonas aquatica TaxID=2743357 RepID=A0A6A7MVR8_9BURK|nr:ATP-binding protein [Rugamonas aquatica]MQA36790.1 hypothetical protein [Rugamonas aquatica]
MTEVIHCLFIDQTEQKGRRNQKDQSVLVVNLTNTYAVTFPTPQTLKIALNSDRYVTAGVQVAGVAGMAVLYGENGAGKTSAMIDIANVFGNNPQEKTAGGLYERDGKLFLRPGKALQGRTVEGIPAEVKKSDELLRCPSVFYTTSPFDGGRRERFGENSLAHDVSPVFGERNTFDGLSLLKICDQLDMPFLDHASIRVRHAVKPVSNAMIAISNMNGGTHSPHVPVVRRAVMAAASELPKGEEIQLRCWLSLFVAVHQRKQLPFPQEFVQKLDLFPESADPGADLYELWKSVINATASNMNETEMTQVMELLQLMLQPKFSKSLSQRYNPAALEQMIAQQLFGYKEGLRLCADLGLLEFSISGLSSGETAYAMIFSSLYGGLEQVSQMDGEHPVFLLLDEGEMFLHPSWQRLYIAKLLDFIQGAKKLKGRLYLLLATHSLIVAADAPPYSLVNVSTGEQVNGFGLGPRSTLADVYEVAVFQGQSSEAEFKRIEAFIHHPRREDYPQIMELTAALADVNVSKFLEQQVVEALERCRE